MVAASPSAGRPEQRDATTALASLRHRLSLAVVTCATNEPCWIILAEGAAHVAAHHGMARLAGVCRGAAASPPDAALPLLRDALAAVPAARYVRPRAAGRSTA